MYYRCDTCQFAYPETYARHCITAVREYPKKDVVGGVTEILFSPTLGGPKCERKKKLLIKLIIITLNVRIGRCF